jgi:hypothetical protein
VEAKANPCGLPRLRNFKQKLRFLRAVKFQQSGMVYYWKVTPWALLVPSSGRAYAYLIATLHGEQFRGGIAKPDILFCRKMFCRLERGEDDRSSVDA